MVGLGRARTEVGSLTGLEADSRWLILVLACPGVGSRTAALVAAITYRVATTAPRTATRRSEDCSCRACRPGTGLATGSLQATVRSYSTYLNFQ